MNPDRLHGFVLIPALLVTASLIGLPVELVWPSKPVAPPAVSSTSSPAIPGGVVKGKVADAITGKAVADALVSVPELGLETRTDRDGAFKIPRIPPRPSAYEVLTTCPGYVSKTVMMTLEAADSPLKLEPIPLRPRGW